MGELRSKLRIQAVPEAAAAAREPAAEPAADSADPASPASRGEGGGGSRERAAHGEPMHQGTEKFRVKDFSISESALCDRLGLSRSDLLALRRDHLQEGVDFVRGLKNQIGYCVSGVEKLAGVIVNGDLKTTLPAAVLCAGEPVKNVSTFHVRRLATNTHVLECVDERGEVVLVRVRSSQNFIPGMEVKAVPYGDLPRVYEYHGPYPRYRGKF